MKKSDIVRRIAEEIEIDLTQIKAEEPVDAILEEIKPTLSQGEAVRRPPIPIFRHVS